MNALHVAIQYNNTGVSLLESGRLDEGLDVFRGAAELMYISTQSTKNQSSISGSTASDEDEKILEVKAKLQHIFDQPAPGSSMNGSSQQENDCFLYHTAIRLPPPTDGQPPNTCAAESATVLFNMALAYHLGSPSPYRICPSLHNACTLYDMAYSVASRLSSEPVSQRVICAALNNMGHLHHELGRYKASREYLDNLSSYIVSLGRYAGDKTSKIERRQFLLNAMLLHRPRGAPAA